MQLTTAIQALSDAQVDFVVIGGVCANLQGSAQLTFDLHVCYDRGGANLRRIISTLAPVHPRPRNLPANLPFTWDEVSLGNSSVLTLRTDLGPIDLLAEVAGLGNPRRKPSSKRQRASHQTSNRRNSARINTRNCALEALVQFDLAIQSVADAEVDFIVISGVSATIHGSTLVTYCSDLRYARNRAEAFGREIYTLTLPLPELEALLESTDKD